MRLSLRKVVFAIFFLPVLAATQTSVPSKNPRTNAPVTSPPQSAAPALPRPSPAPTPPTPNPAGASAPVLSAPKYSPFQLDFGAVDFSASSKRPFSLTAPLAGEITLEFPVGSFVAAELRRVPPLNLGKSQSTLRALVPPMKPVPTSNNGQIELYKWNFAAGEEMQLDIIFAPNFAKDKTPGMRSATMKFAGPGSITPWTVTIPMHGTVNPPKLDLSPQPPISGSQNSGTQAAVASMYKNALGRSADQSGSSASSNAATQSAAGQGMSSATKTSGTQSAYQGVLGRSPSAGPSASASAANSSKMSKPSLTNPVLFATSHRAALSPKGMDVKVLAQLQRQKQAADQEHSRIMAATHGGSSHTMKASRSAGSVAGNTAAANPSVGAGVGGGSQTSQATDPGVENVILCSKAYPEPLIFSINGQKKGAGVVFTTDPDNNLFTFDGCNFSDVQGSMHLYGGFAQGNVPFEIQFWNDHGIVARVQPDLTKELDRDNINLVLTLGNSHQYQFPGYKFYATRQTYKLASIPNVSSKTIFGYPDASKGCDLPNARVWEFVWCGVYSPTQGLTVEVDRAGVKGTSGTDQFTLSGLLPGFEISDIFLWVDPEIGSKQGWGVYSFAQDISVNYVFDWKKPVATYGLVISVSGPRGFDSPWK